MSIRWLPGSLLAAVIAAGCADVRFTQPPSQPCVAASLDWIWSAGMSNGVIDIESPYVFAVSFNAMDWLGWPNPADNIRLGNDWENGAPAQSYELGDFNADGNRDLLIAFSTQKLTRSGKLSLESEEVVIWARDDNKGQFLCARGAVEVR